MRSSCWTVCARLRHSTPCRYSNSDSSAHTTNVITARTTSWVRGSSNPKPARKESSRLTTTSTANPIRNGGAMSSALLMIDHAEARSTWARWPAA